MLTPLGRLGAGAVTMTAAVAIALASAPASYGATTDYRGAFKCAADGLPLAGARIELWQTRVRWLPEVPPNFVHRNTTRADDNGAWGFRVSGGETNWRIRLVLVGPYARVQDWPFPWNWFTHTLRSQNNVPLRDFGTQVVSGYQCPLYTQFDAAGRDYQNETQSPPPQGVTIARAGAPTAGVPFTLYDEVWWPSGYAALDGSISVPRHEFAHVFRHRLDGSEGHFLTDVAKYFYTRHHDADECRRTNSGFAFNEGWAEYWSGENHGLCPGDPGTGLIERNVAAMLADIQSRCRLSRGRMAQVLREHRVHSIDEYSRALNCTPPPAPIRRLGRVRTRKAALVTERRGMLRAGRKIVSSFGRSVTRVRRGLVGALRRARVPVPCPRQPCAARLERRLRPVLLGGQLAQARLLRKNFAFLSSRRAIRRLARVSLRRYARRIESVRRSTLATSARLAVRTLRRMRRLAARLGADRESLQILSQAAVLAARRDPDTLAGMAPLPPASPPRTVGPTPTLIDNGPLAPAIPPLAFADWTAVSGSPASATGALEGSPISLSGTQVDPPPTSVIDGTSPVFNRSDFSPPLTASDAIHIRGATGNSYTLQFGATVTDPVLHLGSLASTLHFAPGTTINRLSGDAEFSVSGSDVVGALDDTPPGDDANGTVSLSGSFSSIPFSTDFPGTDGIYVQAGAR